MRRVTAPAPRVKTCARVAQAPLRLARPYSAAAKPEKPHVVTITSDKAWETHVVQGSSKQPVLVDFTASWCGPCKVLGPRLEDAVSKANGKVVMAKLDIDEFPDITEQNGVSAVPTVIVFHKGKRSEHMFMGNQPPAQLAEFIEKVSKL